MKAKTKLQLQQEINELYCDIKRIIQEDCIYTKTKYILQYSIIEALFPINNTHISEKKQSGIFTKDQETL